MYRGPEAGVCLGSRGWSRVNNGESGLDKRSDRVWVQIMECLGPQ